MSAPILITVPKYVTISSNFGCSSGDSEGDSCIDEFLIRGKRKRLDHLSWEEKLQRKKLKNRVAAQTSRDRKKAKMEDMETTVQLLSDQNTTLKNRCDSLQAQNDKLVDKNNDLERRLNELEKRLEQQQQNNAENVGKCLKTNCDVGCGTNNEGSAVSNNPLLKGLEPQSTTQFVKNKNNDSSALWKVIALCLLYKTYSEISTCLDLKNLPKVYLQMSPQTWRAMIKKASDELPKLKATKSECLDDWWGPQQQTWSPPKISIEV